MNRICPIARLVILLMLQSCRTLNYSISEKIKALEACVKITIANNRAIIYTEVEGKEQPFILDMGATGSVIYDTSVIPNYYKIKKATFGSAKGADRKKMSIARIPLHVTNKLHTSANKVFVVLPKSTMGQQVSCSPSQGTVGLYGYDMMAMFETGYLLDFETGLICNLTKDELAAALAKGYEEIKAKISDRFITIYITVNGVEYAFKFDTGFTGSFSMPYSDKIGFLNDEHTSAEGMQAKTVSGINISEDSYYNKLITFGGSEYVTNITVSKSIKAQNVGMGFVKAFNWVIDGKNKKVYIKKNSVKQDDQKRVTHPYYALADSGKLLVRLRRSGSTEYTIGDQIVKVGNEDVTSANLCEMLKRLNESEDWPALKVVTMSR